MQCIWHAQAEKQVAGINKEAEESLETEERKARHFKTLTGQKRRKGQRARWDEPRDEKENRPGNVYILRAKASSSCRHSFFEGPSLHEPGPASLWMMSNASLPTSSSEVGRDICSPVPPKGDTRRESKDTENNRSAKVAALCEYNRIWNDGSHIKKSTRQVLFWVSDRSRAPFSSFWLPQPRWEPVWLQQVLVRLMLFFGDAASERLIKQ